LVHRGKESFCLPNLDRDRKEPEEFVDAEENPFQDIYGESEDSRSTDTEDDNDSSGDYRGSVGKATRESSIPRSLKEGVR
jgi:hypothetical protein